MKRCHSCLFLTRVPNLYKQLYDNVFNNLNGQPATGVVSDLGTSAAKYFAHMTPLLAVADAWDATMVASKYRTYPNTVTSNSDGTVTIVEKFGVDGGELKPTLTLKATREKI